MFNLIVKMMSNRKYLDLAWKIGTILRGHYEPYEFIGIIGFILVLLKQGKINRSNLDSILKDSIQIDNKQNIRLGDCVRQFPSTEMITQIFNQFNEIENLNYASLFENIISIYISYSGHRYAEFGQPIEVTKLISCLTLDKKVETAYNPFASYASYQIENPNIKFRSQELNRSTWFIGKIRLFLNDINSEDYFCEDSIGDWDVNHKFDLVVATPPFGMPIREPNKLSAGLEFKHKTTEGYILEKSLDSIKENGMVEIIVSPRFLFDKLENDFKEYLISKGFLHSIILLPSNIFSGTSIQTAVITITKSHNDGVIMVDATSFYKKERDRNILDTGNILSTIEKFDSKYIQRVSFDTIKEKELNLNPSIYVNNSSGTINIPEGYQLCKVGNLVTSYNGNKCQVDKAIIVRGQDLANSKFDFEKSFQDLSYEQANKKVSILDRDLLLILRTGHLKPTLFRYKEGINVCCNPNIFTFEIDQLKVDSLYLVNELSKEYVSKQVTERTFGSTISSISKLDFLDIEILIPEIEKQSLAVQRAMYENDKYNYSLSKAKELGLEALLEKQRKDYIEEIRIKKHCLRQYLADITSGVSALTKYVDKHNLGEGVFSEILNMTLSDHLSRLSNTVDEMDRKLELLTQTKDFGEPAKINLLNFLKKFKGTKDYKVEHLIKVSKGAEYIVSINESDFSEVIQNIVSNAVMHGFTEEKSGNVIRIVLSYDRDDNMYVVNISNNGKPMPKGMDSKRYGIKGEIAGNTGHEGIGGYRVKSIIEHFKGSYSVDNDENSLFPVQITIKLPKID